MYQHPKNRIEQNQSINQKIFFEIQRGFSEYYGSTETNTKTNNETISKNGNYYIHHAIFSFHYQKSAIYLNSNSKVLLEICTFYNNSSIYNGGSFYIENSESVLVRICLFHSSCSSWGCSYYVRSIYGSNKKIMHLNAQFQNAVDKFTLFIKTMETSK